MFAILAFQGRNWARMILTIMTAGFTLLLLLGEFAYQLPSDSRGLVVFAVAVIGVSVAGTAML